MPRNSLTRRLVRHLFLVSLAGCFLAVFSRGWDEWDGGKDPDSQPLPAPKPTPQSAQPARKGKARRFAMAFSFCALFFAGLAFSAGAGNQVREFLGDNSTAVAQSEDTTATTTTGAETDTTATTTTGTDQAAPAPAPAAQPTQLQSHVNVTPAKPALLSARPMTDRGSTKTLRAVQASTKQSTVKQGAGKRSRGSAPKKQRQKLHKLKKAQPLDAEGSLPGATVWLYQQAPDPTPPAARLRLRFARELVAYSRQAHVDWALVLAVLRSGGHSGRVPATSTELRNVALKLGTFGGRANGWAAALSYSSDTGFADHTVALRHYYRAVGLASLVYGLRSQKRDLEDRILHNDKIEIYPGGRQDIENHKVDVRVLAVILYLKQTFHEVTVSCLISGHRLYARPGVVSAHIYGRAVDIAALGGVPIFGHQEPGGVTEQAVRALLMLPGRMLPAQIISLLGLGGPSFPLANHYDHIHVGY
ncbi:MAG TPA: hypothetical protein VLU96_12440 [Gaiellaceae bacterium]|nr:hypothetical protein [Gaiellaceae bacterium]